MRSSIALVLSALLMPALASAQVTSFNGRTGAVTPATGDYVCSQVTNCGPTNTANTWGGSQLFADGPVINGGYWNGGTHGQVTTINTSGFGLSNPPNSTILYMRGPDGVGAMEDIFVYTGSMSANTVSPTVLQQTRSGTNNGGFVACPKGQWTSQWGAKTFNGVSETSDAYLITMCTEDHTSTANGMGYEFLYKPNGASNAMEAMAISREGLGGVTIGNVDSGTSLPHSQPYDLGPGTLNAASDIASGGHFKSIVNAYPTLSSCGSGPSVAGGSDQAAAIVTGGSVSSCTINFHSSYGSSPICVVTMYNTASSTPYVTSLLPTSFTVAFSNPFSGVFLYVCMGLG
jgi:hypothetical protein